MTTLADSGPGSLREACEAEGPRIVVFRVSGPIALRSTLRIVNPYITIAGQTASGSGVCLKNETRRLLAVRSGVASAKERKRAWHDIR